MISKGEYSKLKKLWKRLEKDLSDADEAEDSHAFCEARGALAGAEAVMKELGIRINNT